MPPPPLWRRLNTAEHVISSESRTARSLAHPLCAAYRDGGIGLDVLHVLPVEAELGAGPVHSRHDAWRTDQRTNRSEKHTDKVRALDDQRAREVYRASLSARVARGTDLP